MAKLPNSLLEFLLFFLKPHQNKLILILLLMIPLAIHPSLQPYTLKLIIDRVSNFGEATHLIFEDYQLLKLIIIFGSLSLIYTIEWRIYDYLKLKLLPNLKLEIFSKVTNHLTFYSHQFFQNQLSGKITNKINDLSRGIDDLIEPLISLLRILLVIISAIIIAAQVHLYFALGLTLWTILFIIVAILLAKSVTNQASCYAKARSNLTGKLTDLINNIANIRLFAQEQFEHHYLNQYNDQTKEAEVILRKKLLKVWLTQGLLCCLVLWLMIYLLIYLRARNLITLGDFAFIMMISITILQEVWVLSELFANIARNLGIYQQALSIIKYPDKLVDEPNQQELLILQGEIQFKQVFFSYQGRRNLFNNKNILIKAKQKIGLVGYSGSGKTSFINLIIRLFDLNSGQILIDQQDISKVSVASLRKNISFIPQEALLFHRSILENIRYSKPTASDQEVIEAAKLAQAHNFIKQLTQGYNSLAGERGAKLSGGQRQRIIIARAILKDAPILILDEATSSLDLATQEQINLGLRKLMQDKTVIAIAHRLSTLVDMDKILVFKRGKIVESGTHFELLKQDGLYASMWNLQLRDLTINN